LGNLNAKVGREDIFKLTIGNESLHKINNDTGVRVVNFVTYKIFIKSAMLPRCDINKYTWTSPEGNVNSQMDDVLIDRIWHFSLPDVRSLRG
jgi:hypothetical protein